MLDFFLHLSTNGGAKGIDPLRGVDFEEEIAGFLELKSAG